MRPRTRTATACVLLFAGTLLLFCRATRFGFINYDDPTYLTDNPQVQGGLSWAGLRWAFAGQADYWHPLSWLSHMLDWQLYGPSAGGHHLTSVLWHALNAALAFLVFQRLAGGFWRSLFAAALFAWHPLRVESVVWITERKDVMSGCFFLLTLLSYARYVSVRNAGGPAWRPYLITLACFAAGLMCKPMVVSLPLVLLALDFWPFSRGGSPARWWHLVIEKLPFLALSAAAGVTTIYMQRHSDAFVLDLPMAARAGNAVVSLARYLGKFFWPVDLVVCYPHPGYWPIAAVVAAAALTLALCWLAWRQRRARPWTAVGLGWFLVCLLPAIGLIQVGFQSMADRYTYLPLMGIELALIWSVPSPVSRTGQMAGAVAAALLLAACAARTWNQEGFWRDSVSLFEHAVHVSDSNDVAEGFLASALVDVGRFDDAALHARRALELNPRNEQALVLLAGDSERQGKADEAMVYYRSALDLKPDDMVVQCQLGMIELSRGNTGQAGALMTPALKSVPSLRARTSQIASVALGRGDTTSALFLFNLVLAAAPDDTEAQVGAGLALLDRNDPADAIAHLRAAAGKAPGFADAQVALADCADRLGLSGEASTALARAEAAAPENAAILSHLADLSARRHDFTAAIRLYRRVAELAPADSDAHVALGFLLMHEGDRAGGIAEWRRALEIDPNIPGLRERLTQAAQ
jgi:protein O-mannosyl-transferase